MAKRMLAGWRNSAKLVVAAALLLAACGGGNPGSPPTPSATPTATAHASIQQPTATATAEPSATATELSPIEESPTPDTRVPMGLPTLDQIQLGPDGKYFVADRGDGCTWVEYLRDTSPVIGLQVFLRTDCPADFGFTYRPERGEILVLVP
jgi:hypothetical protein